MHISKVSARPLTAALVVALALAQTALAQKPAFGQQRKGRVATPTYVSPGAPPLPTLPTGQAKTLDYDQQRLLIRHEPFLKVRGKLQVRHNTLNIVAERFEAMPRPTAMLNLKYGDEVLLCWRENETVVVGRDRGCGLVVDASFASRRHCTITLRHEGFSVCDHSSNGTYLTNEGSDEIVLVNGEAPLAAHGWIGFGRSRLLSTQLLQFFGK